MTTDDGAGTGNGLRRMVFGDDLSPGADVAWLWINDHQWPGWRLDVIHVPEDDMPGKPGQSEALQPWSPHDARPLFEGTGFEQRRHLTSAGDVRAVLGHQHDADLLVIGPTGNGFLKRWLHLGSTAVWLLDEPPAPMMIVKTARRTRRVLVTADGSEAALRAATALKSWPWAPTVDIHVLGVHDGWSEPDAGVAAAVDLLDGSGLSVSSSVLRGKPGRTIVEWVKDHQPELVVLGATGTHGLRRAVLGSTAAGVVRSIDANVLITA